MNRIRDAFVRKLLTVYYGVEIRKMEGLSVREGSDYYQKHFKVILKTGGEEHLILKQYEGDVPLEWKLNNSEADTSTLDDFIFGMRLKNGDYVYFLSSGPVCEEKILNSDTDAFLDIVLHLESFAAVSDCGGTGELSVPLTPERLRYSLEGIHYTDVNGLCRHVPGYSFWGLCFGFDLSPEKVSCLIEDYYERLDLPAEEWVSAKRNSFMEYIRVNNELNTEETERAVFE